MHPTTKKSTRILFAPLISFCNWLGENHPVALVKLRYFVRFKKMPDLSNPKDMNEKILYLKLFTDTSKWTELADKYRVRDYVKEKGLEQYLVNLYDVWYNVRDIDFQKLPSSFILKANNGCGKGSNLIVQDKQQLDKPKTLKLLEIWLHEKHIGALAAEPQYKNMTPCIIAESLLPVPKGHKSLVDYKIWCFNGKAYYIWTCSDRDNDGTEVMLYDRDWTPLPHYCIFDDRYRKGGLMDKPQNLSEMLLVAETLTKGFPCVRLDLYNIDGRIYFGEMTFTSLGGMMNFYTPEFLLLCGSKINIDNSVKQ